LLNLGLIGFGYWGPNIARNAFVSKKVKLRSICEIKRKRLYLAKKTYGTSIEYCEDYRNLLEDPQIDAIAVAVETDSHYEIGKNALIAGKHLFMEKPFTSTSFQAIELKKIAEENHLIVHVDHIMIYHPIVRRIAQMISEGAIGELIYFDVSRMNLGKLKADVNSMWDLAVHDLAILDLLSQGKEPLLVQAMGVRRYGPRELLTYLTLQYETFIAHIKSSWLSPIKERRMIFAGTKKMLVFDDMKVGEKLYIYDKGFDTQAIPLDIEYGEYAVKIRNGDLFVPNIPEEDSLMNSLEHFATCIEEKKPSISDPDQAIRLIKILERADRDLIH